MARKAQDYFEGLVALAAAQPLESGWRKTHPLDPVFRITAEIGTAKCILKEGSCPRRKV